VSKSFDLDPILIGHRGAAALAPENTERAFERALESGIGWIETDIRMTRDGVLVLHHDSFLDNMRIEEMTFDELRHRKNDIAALDPILERFGRELRFNLELKVAGISDFVAESVRSSGQTSRVLISSFHYRELYASMAAHPEMDHAPLFSGRPLTLDSILAAFPRFSCVVVDAEFVDSEFVEEASRVNTPVWVYNTGICTNLPRLAGMGIKGFIVDDPVACRKVLGL